MNERQAYALAHPLNEATGEIDPYRSVEEIRRDEFLVVVLAVDR